MYTLYWNPFSASLAPDLVLQEAGLPYERVLIDIRKGENLEPAYRAVNPAGFVPALRLPDGRVIAETAAIVLCLCERHDLPLAPAPDEPERPVFLHLLFYLSNVMQTAYKLYFYPQRFSTEGEAAAAGIKARALEMVGEQWDLIEARLGEAPGPYLLGERCLAIDLYLAMLVTWHPDRPGLLARLPALGRCFAAVTARPVVARLMALYGS